MIISSRHLYIGKQFLVPFMMGQGTTFRVDPSMVHTLWDQSNLNGVNLPTVHGRADFPRRTGLYVLDMPIKMPGTDYRIPSNLSQYAPLIKRIAERGGSDGYCYLTVDESGMSRNHGCHVDGFQGERIGDPLPCDHSFIMYDRGDTDFFKTKFSVEGLDRTKHNFFKEFDKQVTTGDIVRYAPNIILEMDCYTIHRAADVQGDRTFFRMSYSMREFDRLGNTINPMFNYDWDMVVRDISRSLTIRHSVLS